MHSAASELVLTPISTAPRRSKRSGCHGFTRPVRVTKGKEKHGRTLHLRLGRRSAVNKEQGVLYLLRQLSTTLDNVPHGARAGAPIFSFSSSFSSSFTSSRRLAVVLRISATFLRHFHDPAFRSSLSLGGNRFYLFFGSFDKLLILLFYFVSVFNLSRFDVFHIPRFLVSRHCQVSFTDLGELFVDRLPINDRARLSDRFCQGFLLTLVVPLAVPNLMSSSTGRLGTTSTLTTSPSTPIEIDANKVSPPSVTHLSKSKVESPSTGREEKKKKTITRPIRWPLWCLASSSSSSPNSVVPCSVRPHQAQRRRMDTGRGSIPQYLRRHWVNNRMDSLVKFCTVVRPSRELFPFVVFASFHTFSLQQFIAAL